MVGCKEYVYRFNFLYFYETGILAYIQVYNVFNGKPWYAATLCNYSVLNNKVLNINFIFYGFLYKGSGK